MANFCKTFKSLNTDFTAARLDLAAMAITHFETSGNTFKEQVKLYIDLLEYTQKEAIKATSENKKAYSFMIGSGFTINELEAMASSI